MHWWNACKGPGALPGTLRAQPGAPQPERAFHGRRFYFLPPFSSGHLCFRGLIQLRLRKRKSIRSCRLTSRTNFFCLILEIIKTCKGREVGGRRARLGRKGSRRSPGAQLRGQCPPQEAGGQAGRQAGRASRAEPFLGLQCPLSRGRRIAPPAAFRTEPAAEGLRGQLPRPPLIASR